MLVFPNLGDMNFNFLIKVVLPDLSIVKIYFSLLGKYPLRQSEYSGLQLFFT